MSRRRPLIAVYIMASRPFGVTYIGVTSNLFWRVHQHREGLLQGFTSRYDVTMLVWWEPHESIRLAIQREKSLKRYRKMWKWALIEGRNPGWLDLYPALCGWGADPRVKPEDDGGEKRAVASWLEDLDRRSRSRYRLQA